MAAAQKKRRPRSKPRNTIAPALPQAHEVSSGVARVTSGALPAVIEPDALDAHDSDSREQRAVEREVITALARELRVRFIEPPASLKGLALDGYAVDDRPVLVEAFAHVGPSKSGQRRKLSHDFTKLLLAERLLGVPCRKVVAVIDARATAYLQRSWSGRFAAVFGIEVVVVPGFEGRYAELTAVQQRQRR